MKPQTLKTKIFLDGGDVEETKKIISLTGFLDGQTTNPTLISKNPETRRRLEKGDNFTEEEIYSFYKNVAGEISSLIPL
ncbi:MAG: transaldolase, partial [Nitrospiraceae bacterium]